MKKIILLTVFALLFSMTGGAKNYLNGEKTYSLISDISISNSLVIKHVENSNLMPKDIKNLEIQSTVKNENIDSDLCGRIAFLVFEVLRQLDIFDNKTLLYVVLVVEQACRNMI